MTLMVTDATNPTPPDTTAAPGPAFNSSLYTLHSQGAEARVWEGVFLGRPTMVKQRFSKKYRHPSLDAKLTAQRLKGEVRSMLRARKLGVPTPVVYHVDHATSCIYMERVQGHSVKTLLRSEDGGLTPAEVDTLLVNMGKEIARMHDGGLVHGDLTTSNMIVRQPDEQVVVIDFGLSYNSTIHEDKAVDLYVLERAFSSAHAGQGPQLFEKVLEAYCRSSKQWSSTLNRFAEVRMRGRKRTMASPSGSAEGTLLGCNYGAARGDAWPSWNTAAIGMGNSLATSLPLGACGTCIEIQCGNSTSPQGNTLDSAFWPLAEGRFGASVRYISAPHNVPSSEPFKWRSTESHENQARVVQVAGSGSIKTVWLRSSTGQATGARQFSTAQEEAQWAAAQPGWKAMSNTDGASWEMSGPPAAPLDVLLVDKDDEMILARSLIPFAGVTGDFQVNSQFPSVPRASSPPITGPPALTALGGITGNFNATVGASNVSQAGNASTAAPPSLLLANLTKQELLQLTLVLPNLEKAAVGVATGSPSQPGATGASPLSQLAPSPSPHTATAASDTLRTGTPVGLPAASEPANNSATRPAPGSSTATPTPAAQAPAADPPSPAPAGSPVPALAAQLPAAGPPSPTPASSPVPALASQGPAGAASPSVLQNSSSPQPKPSAAQPATAVPPSPVNSSSSSSATISSPVPTPAGAGTSGSPLPSPGTSPPVNGSLATSPPLASSSPAVRNSSDRSNSSSRTSDAVSMAKPDIASPRPSPSGVPPTFTNTTAAAPVLASAQPPLPPSHASQAVADAEARLRATGIPVPTPQLQPQRNSSEEHAARETVAAQLEAHAARNSSNINSSSNRSPATPGELMPATSVAPSSPPLQASATQPSPSPVAASLSPAISPSAMLSSSTTPSLPASPTSAPSPWSSRSPLPRNYKPMALIDTQAPSPAEADAPLAVPSSSTAPASPSAEPANPSPVPFPPSPPTAVAPASPPQSLLVPAAPPSPAVPNPSSPSTKVPAQAAGPETAGPEASDGAGSSSTNSGGSSSSLGMIVGATVGGIAVIAAVLAGWLVHSKLRRKRSAGSGRTYFVDNSWERTPGQGGGTASVIVSPRARGVQAARPRHAAASPMAATGASSASLPTRQTRANIWIRNAQQHAPGDGLGTLQELDGSEASSSFSDLFSTQDQLLFPLEEHAEAAGGADSQGVSVVPVNPGLAGAPAPFTGAQQHQLPQDSLPQQHVDVASRPSPHGLLHRPQSLLFRDLPSRQAAAPSNAAASATITDVETAALHTSPAATIPTPLLLHAPSSRLGTPLGTASGLLPPLPPTSAAMQHAASRLDTSESDDSFMSVPARPSQFARFDMKTTAHALETGSDAGIMGPAPPTTYTLGSSGSFSRTGALPSATVWKLCSRPTSSDGASSSASSFGSTEPLKMATPAAPAGETVGDGSKGPAVRYPAWPQSEV
ncbi:hypothetical protein N2152v2_004107 [Parachlorella kessleri]